jgi:hypothetical protein
MHILRTVKTALNVAAAMILAALFLAALFVLFSPRPSLVFCAVLDCP